MKLNLNLMELLFNVLHEHGPDSVDYQIAWFILTHVNLMNKMSLTMLADQCKVAKSSVSRFCERIGLEDYSDLQMRMRNFELKPADKFRFSYTGNDPGNALEYMDTVIHNLQMLRNTMDVSCFSELLSDLHQYDQVAAFGHLQSGNIAYSLQNDLMVCGKMIYSTENQEYQKQWLQAANNSWLLVVFSVSGAFFDRLHMSHFLKHQEQRPRIWMITTCQMSVKPPYIYKIVSLAPSGNYSTANILPDVYGKMLALEYYTHWGR